MSDSRNAQPYYRNIKKRAAGRYPLLSPESELRRYKTGLEEINGKLDRILAALNLPATNVTEMPKRRARA